MKKLLRDYTHEKLKEEVRFIAGYYLPEEEKRLGYKGREVLYIIGFGAIDNSCCGTGGCRYALVPGYLLKWKVRNNEDGKPISEIEPIKDKDDRAEIAGIIRGQETITQIEFW
ncbi:MAG: hypothetical protein SWO11_09695 [Thermodesulfobacteriota bacterium]|nr:hypothetical protein [Thermodesulfobacteriota bacterium]